MIVVRRLAPVRARVVVVVVVVGASSNAARVPPPPPPHLALMPRRATALVACVVQNDPGRASARTKRDNIARVAAIVDRALDDDDLGRDVGIIVCAECFAHEYTLTAANARAWSESGAGEVDGECVTWARALAAQRRCVVVVGYVRRVGQALFNAQALIDADGVVRSQHHKTHLYDMDEAWAEEGDGFTTNVITVKTVVREENASGARVVARGTADVRCTQAICMDINPYQFKAPWDAYELANAVKAAGETNEDGKHLHQLLLFSSAWTNAHPNDAEELKRAEVDVSDVLSYWYARLEPLRGTKTHFVCANRIGEENLIKFCGCSCVIDMRAQRVLTCIEPGVEDARLVPILLDEDEDHRDDLVRDE